MTLGERIKQKRERKELTAEKVSEKLEVDISEYLKWESGDCEPDTDTLLRLAKILGTTATTLLYGKDGMGAQSMFPKDATPTLTPLSDWRFLIGAMLMFTGGAGALMFIMRNSYNAHGIREYFEIGGLPFLGILGIFLIGLIVCVVSSVTDPRRKRKKKKKK